MTDWGKAGNKAAGRYSSTEIWSSSADQVGERDIPDISAGNAAGRLLAGVARRVKDRFVGSVQRAGPPNPASGRSWVRDVDRWFALEVSPHERGFLTLARRLTGDAEAAHDLVHDVYAELLVGDKWQTLSHPRAYVRRMIYNLGFNRLKRAKIVPMQQLAKVETVTYADISPDAFESLSSRQELDVVLAALSLLPVRSRKVVLMRRVDGISPREIANQMGISISTVETHLANGLAALSDLLAESDDDQLVSRAAPPRKDRRRDRPAVVREVNRPDALDKG